jgi:branched-chain amino acid transport system substrate-binding protein
VKTKLVLRAAPLAVAALALAACGGSSSGGKTSSGGGNGKVAIGFQGPLSGGLATLGINERNAVQLAVEQANASHALPYTLGFVQSDDQGGAAGSPPAATKLTGDSSIVAVVGPSFSGASKAAGDIYKRAGLLMATPSATLPDLVTLGFSTFFRGIADDNSQGAPDADYLVKKAGKKNIFLVDDTTDYGVGLAKLFKAEVPKAGGKLAGTDEAPQTSTCVPGATGSTSQYGSEASKVVSSHADAVFYAGYDCDAALFAKALRSGGFTGLIMSDDGTKSDTYTKNAGKAGNGTIASCQCSYVQGNPKAQEFVKAYKARFGIDASTYSGEAYDVANAIISVLKGLGAHPTRSQVVSAFASVDYQGVTNEVTFDSNHNLKSPHAYLYKDVNGAWSYLGDLQQLVG